MRLTEKEYQTLLKQGNVQEVQRQQGASCPQETILTQVSVRHVSPGKSVSRRQQRGMLAAKIAVAAWRAQLAALAPREMRCRQCQTLLPHQCTPAGWRCGGCGAEKLLEEQGGRRNANS